MCFSRRKTPTTHPNLVILAARREPVRLRGEVFVLGRARALEGNVLEVARRYRLAVVPADLERSDAHCRRVSSEGGRGMVVVRGEDGMRV